MGLINLLGFGRRFGPIGAAVEQVAEVFVANKTKSMAQDHAQYIQSSLQFEREFSHPNQGWFDSVVNGLNRLPRPVLALGTVGLFCFAMVDPTAFSLRMQGLDSVPDPLWWLLGAVVSFYFGARELHYARRKGAIGKDVQTAAWNRDASPEQQTPMTRTDGNPAVVAWRRQSDR